MCVFYGAFYGVFYGSQPQTIPNFEEISECDIHENQILDFLTFNGSKTRVKLHKKIQNQTSNITLTNHHGKCSRSCKFVSVINLL